MSVRTANKSYYKKFVATEGETEGKLFFQLGKGQWDTPSVRSMLENALSNEDQITDFEVKYHFEEAGERILLLNACRIVRIDSAEVLILLALDDVTEARIRAEGLASFSRELEKEVEERTASLKESNRSLKQSNDNLEQFATIASHDLQEPLRKIMTFSAILNKRHSNIVSGEVAELINKIGQSSKRMSVLIHDVLNFSKVLDASVLDSVDLNQILKDVMNDFDLLIEQKKARVSYEELPVIKAVRLQMNQLFYNLLGNALKFSKPDSAPLIHISSRKMTSSELENFPSLRPESVYYEIIFKDDGIGIDEKFSQQVFEIFQRLNAREHFEGTGIGLALCKRIVQSHNGEIFIISTKGIGSQFHVILPLE